MHHREGGAGRTGYRRLKAPVELRIIADGGGGDGGGGGCCEGNQAVLVVRWYCTVLGRVGLLN